MNKLIILVLPLVVNCKNNTNSEANLSELVPNSQSTIEIKDSLLKQPVLKDSLKKENSKRVIKNDTIKKNFQEVVNPFLGKAFEQKEIKHLQEVIKKLDATTISKSDKMYWTAYMNYNMSIISNINKNTEKAEKYIEEAINLLNNSKTSEDYALLAACKSFSIQFANIMTIASISQEVQDNAKKSIELNPKNLRAYTVLCSNNFYTPPMFGGMTKVEEYALKGLACPISSDDQAYYAPRWGKRELYDYLIQYLQKKKPNSPEIEKYKSLMNTEFPY